MKPTFFFIALLVSSLGFSAFAQKTVQQHTPTTIQFNEVFTTVSVEDDMAVVLTEGNSDKIIVEGDVKASIVDGHLYVAAKNSRRAAGMTVFVPANYLTKVFLNGNGSLRSATVLPNQKIKIHLASEARINVRSTGNLSIETVDDIEFVKGR